MDFLAVLFGIGTWIAANSIFVQLPLLVLRAPESWNLASYIVIMIQLANLGPISYGLMIKFKNFNNRYFIYFLLGLSIISSICMILFHDISITIFGAQRSGVLLILVFCFAVVGCTSSVLFMPYMGNFQEIYLITYLIGEGLSGFVPSVIALFQGVGGNTICIPSNSTVHTKMIPYTPPPRFGIETFFLIILSILITSFISFLILDRLYNQEKNGKKLQKKSYLFKDPELDTNAPLKEIDAKPELTKANKSIISTMQYKGFLFLLGAICLLSIGFFPAIMIYSALPYGNITYHLVVTLNSIANPIACFLAFFIPHTSTGNIIKMTVLTFPLIFYATLTSLMSPTPPLINHFVGELLVVRFDIFLEL